MARQQHDFTAESQSGGLSLVFAALLQSLIRNQTEVTARMEPPQVATVLGFPVSAIPILDRAGLLKPLGKPTPNAPKYYAAIDVFRHAVDRDWLDKATKVLARHWRDKNQRKRQGLTAAA